MPAKRPSPAIATMLVDRDIALWDAAHYTTAASAHPGRPTTKDPVRVVLVTPRALDQHFSGTGATTDEAVLDAISRNPGLRSEEEGLGGAMGRLEIALHGLVQHLWMQRLDDDIPF